MIFSERAAKTVGLFIEQILDVDREIARLIARRVWLVDQARLWSEASVDAIVASSFSSGRRAELARRSLTAEIACATRIPEATACRLLDESEALVHELPETRAALAAGAIGFRHAQVMCNQARSLPGDARRAFESSVLPAALTSTASQFSRAAGAQRERSHPESMVTRAQKAAADRHVSFESDRDGMAWLHHYLPAVDAVRIDDTLDQLARHLRDDALAAACPPTRHAPGGTSTNFGGEFIETGRGAECYGSSIPSGGSDCSDISSSELSDGSDFCSSKGEIGGGSDYCSSNSSELSGGSDFCSSNSKLSGGSDYSSSSRSTELSDSRTLAQLRSDALRDLLLRDPVDGSPRPLRPTVIVSVPVMTLLGHDDAPATLDGYGPIDADTARDLCAHAPSFLRILTHPETGATLSVGRDHYRPPADLKTALQVADQTCRFPGCARRAVGCEIDHTWPWQAGGATDFTNLAHLCPKHHHLKHETAWAVSIDRDRTLHWRSPSGRHYDTHAAAPPPPINARTDLAMHDDAPF
ncbi:HNH endonuclease signature motif containing protein [Subtercola sp. YIM 133946]|uniref:HNH endonuclease signature motif containing protein n=1 Tax=Subtercola sp. YIM 133946 TaxID=3118909 RepID=UPI002F923CD7